MSWNRPEINHRQRLHDSLTEWMCVRNSTQYVPECPHRFGFWNAAFCFQEQWRQKARYCFAAQWRFL